MAADDEERVELRIDGQKFVGWTETEIFLSMDSFSTVEFVAPFEHERREFRDTFRPFSYKEIELDVWNERMFRGHMVGVHPEVTPTSRTVKVNCYALPGVFNDCTIPPDALPTEFLNLPLRGIANLIAEHFDIRVYFPDEDGAYFPTAKLKKDQKILEFLTELAQHRNFVVSNTLDGSLLIWRSVKPGKPVARLKDNEQPVTAVDAEFSPQEYYSEITGFAPAKRGRDGSRFTANNPWLPSVLRPLCFTLDQIEKGDAPEATKAKVGRMFGNMAAFSVDVATWRDPSGHLWQPNTTVTLTAPDCMVYTETELIVRTVKFKQTPSETSATLGLVLPGAFSGEVPERLPWDEAS
jgi:prophage tail gpP-like protein